MLLEVEGEVDNCDDLTRFVVGCTRDEACSSKSEFLLACMRARRGYIVTVLVEDIEHIFQPGPIQNGMCVSGREPIFQVPRQLRDVKSL
jgi:hypothetical protein